MSVTSQRELFLIRSHTGYPQNLWITLWMSLSAGPTIRAYTARLSNWSNFVHALLPISINNLSDRSNARPAKDSSSLFIPAGLVVDVHNRRRKLANHCCVESFLGWTSQSQLRSRRSSGRGIVRQKKHLQVVEKTSAERRCSPAKILSLLDQSQLQPARQSRLDLAEI
jgi:hypothetical protein